LTFNRSFFESEVFHISGGVFETRQHLINLERRFSELWSEASDKYKTARGQKGIISIGAIAQGDKDFEMKYQKLMNESMRNFFKSKNAVMTLLNGMTYTPANNEGSSRYGNEVNDLKGIYDDALTRAAQVLRFPVQLIRGEVTEIEKSFNYAFSVCLEPIMLAIEQELTGKYYTPRDILAGRYIKADGSKIRHVDVLGFAAGIDKLISCGFASVNEARELAGLKPINEEWADGYFVTKNYEAAEK
jgi:hypothetical protein